MTPSSDEIEFHFKNTRTKDPLVLPIGQWLQVNQNFYVAFKKWLKASSYGPSALNIYGVAVRSALGFLRKPYWTIDPEADLEAVRRHLQETIHNLATYSGYTKGLAKFGEYLRFTLHRPEKPKEIRWETYVGCLSLALQTQVREFIHFRQCAWPAERRVERAHSLLSPLTKPLRFMARQRSIQSLAEVTPQLWLDYLDGRIQAGISPVTLNLELAELKALTYFVQEHGQAVCERLLLQDYLDEGSSIPKDVPLEQLRVLQQAIQAAAASPHAGISRCGRMDRAWFLLMLHSGLRTGEIRRLTFPDIEWEAKRVRIEQSKGLKDRLVCLSAATLEALKAYLELRGPAEALPVQVFIYRHRPLSGSYCLERLQTYWEVCGVHVHPHQLRHSCATLLLNAGAPVLTVQTILGHQRIDTTLGYARLYDGTIAADYYQAMQSVERQLALPEDQMARPPSLGELIALVDSLRNGSLTPSQTEVVWTLRSGLTLLAEKEKQDVKVLRQEPVQV
jgi:site-specific recombinase XerD